MRRPRSAVAFAAATALAVGACGGVGRSTACAPVEHPEFQVGSHLVGDAPAPVPYSSTPGTSGWHAGGAVPSPGVYEADAPLAETKLVYALENGQVVAAYAPSELAEDELERLRDLARGELAGTLTVTPFEEDMGAPLVLNAWGTRQPCSEVDPDVIANFVEEHRYTGGETG